MPQDQASSHTGPLSKRRPCVGVPVCLRALLRDDRSVRVAGTLRVIVFGGCLVGLHAACGFPRPADVPGDDGGVDSAGTIDAQTCFGKFLRICFASAPSVPLTIAAPSMIDTDSPLCASVVSGGENYCVIAATSITVNATVRATGTKPLVLIATESIMTTALIDVSSYRDGTANFVGPAAIGAGADPRSCSAGTLPPAGGGHAGGSFAGLGGAGGLASDGSSGGSPAATVASVSELRGGCPSPIGTTTNVGGYGGGAVFLIAGQLIELQGGINASGASGRGAGPGNKGGFGGGSGGMIGLEAPTIMCNSLLLASGGGGGGGSSGITPGGDGHDPATIDAALGGTGPNNAAGGDGSSSSSRTAPGAPGHQGDSGGQGAGGGAGGGGAGLIKAPLTAELGTMVSPPPTP